MQKVMHQLCKVCGNAIELPYSTKLRNKRKCNALAHILPKIGRVICLTLKNVRDLNVEGHASIVHLVHLQLWIL